LDVYDRRLASFELLNAEERRLWVLLDARAWIEMDGWAALVSGGSAWMLPMLKDTLKELGADASVRVLESYEEYMRARGISTEPADVADFLLRGPNPDTLPDWGEQFMEVFDDALALLEQWLRERGIVLVFR
jgi:hypothetical protein